MLFGLTTAIAAEEPPAPPAVPAQPPLADLRHKVASAARTVFLVGSVPDGLHTRCLGQYDRTDGSEDEMGRPVYTRQEEPGTLMWASPDKHWVIGFREQLGMLSSEGYLRVNGTATHFVEQISEQAVWSAKRVKNGTASWIVASDLRLLPGRAGDEAWQQQQNDENKALERATDQLYLVGNTPMELRRDYLGKFVRRAQRKHGRFTYHRQGPHPVALWYDGNGQWRVGPSQSVGSELGVLELGSAVVLPEESQGTWRVQHPLKGTWLDAPGVRLMVGEEGRNTMLTQESARKVRLKKAAARVRLTGEMPSGVGPEHLGEYIIATGSNVNGHPYYVKAGNSKLGMWATPGSTWFIGVAARQDQFGHAKGALRVNMDAASQTLADFASGTLEAWVNGEATWVAAPKLRLETVKPADKEQKKQHEPRGGHQSAVADEL